MAAPVLPYLFSGTVFDIYGNSLADATVTLAHSSISPSLSATSASDGKYIIDLSGLDTQWVKGDIVTITASKTAEGTKTITTTIKTDIGGQTENITLAETSDVSILPTDSTDRRNLHFALITHYDKAKVTRERPFPVQTENALDRYQPADDDLSADPNYTSFTDRLGRWYIQRDNLASGTHRYFRGTSDYETNWENRTDLDYDFYHNVF